MKTARSKRSGAGRLAAAAAALLLAFAVPGAAQEGTPEAPPDAARWEALARERLAAVKAEPRNAERMADFGETLLTAGHPVPARKALERARMAGALRAEVLLAECALRDADAGRDAAKAALATAALGDPEDPRTALLESLAKESLGDVEGALDAAVMAAELAERSDAVSEELAHRVLDQLERCVRWNRVFSLVE